jgi:hypothetical protein
VDELEFRVEHGSIERVADLFPAVRARTADFRTLSPEVALKPMFTELQELGAALEFRLTDKRAFRPVLPPRPWMVALGCGLQRVSLAEEEHTERVRELGVLLATTHWQTVQFLRVTPYLDGAPAGPPRSPEVLWHERMLYVLDHPMSQLFKPLVDELSRVFGWPSISDAIKACVDRDEEFVEGYIEHNFELVEDVELETDQTSFDADEETEEAATSWEDDTTRPTISSDKDQITEGIRVGEGKEPSTTTAFDDIATSPEEQGNEEEEVNVAAEVGTLTESPVPKPRPESHVSLIDLYAKLTGFHWDRRRALYVHPNGRTLGKCHGIFNYELMSAVGNTERRLWVSKQCLTDGVEISADLWDVVSRTQECIVVLITPDGQPHELLGPTLSRMAESGDVKLFPATYRLRQVS